MLAIRIEWSYARTHAEAGLEEFAEGVLHTVLHKSTLRNEMNAAIGKRDQEEVASLNDASDSVPGRDNPTSEAFKLKRLGRRGHG